MAHKRKAGKVSIWAGNTKIDEDVDILKDLCGIGSYDLDDQEINVDDVKWKSQRIAKLVADLSYSASFAGAVIEECQRRGLNEALYIVAQFDFIFDPKANKIRKGAPIFLGAFDWSGEE
jgi:hypothetical protein